MTDNEILALVKAAMGVSGTDLDARLLIHLKAVKNLMTNYDIEIEELESDLGIQAIALGVQDFMNGNPGEVKFSLATEMAIIQLHHKSLPEVEDDV